MEITGQTQLLGVIGYPIRHSLSPVMHNAALTELGANYVYVPFPIAPQDLATAIAAFPLMGVKGFNVTIPHKQTIMPLLSAITPTAERIGAVNTVYWTDQGWQGTNTDGLGFVAPLTALARDWSTIKAVILGAGGSARAVVDGLAQLGCEQMQVVGRNREKLAQFQQSWSTTDFYQRLTVHPWESLSTLLPTAQLIVNTTPVGMTPQIDQSPLSESFIQRLPQTAIAYDLIYTPRPTRFLQLAQGQGLTVIDGSEMLVQQGAAALQLWLKQSVPSDTMRQALHCYLQKTA